MIDWNAEAQRASRSPEARRIEQDRYRRWRIEDADLKLAQGRITAEEHAAIVAKAEAIYAEKLRTFKCKT